MECNTGGKHHSISKQMVLKLERTFKTITYTRNIVSCRTLKVETSRRAMSFPNQVTEGPWVCMIQAENERG